MEEKYGPNEDDWPYIDEDIYLDTIGPPNKGRYYGLRSSGMSTMRSGRSHTTHTSSSSHDNTATGSRTTGLGVDLEQVMSLINDIYKRMDDFTQQMRTEVEERYGTASSADAATVDEARRQSMLDIEAFKNEMQATMEDKLKKLKMNDVQRIRRKRRIVSRNRRSGMRNLWPK